MQGTIPCNEQILKKIGILNIDGAIVGDHVDFE